MEARRVVCRSGGVGGTFAGRRGAVILVIVVLLAVISIAVVGGVAASTLDAQIGLLRVETIRAFYAAESGTTVAVKGLLGSGTTPSDGDTLTLGSQTVHFVQVPEPPGDVVVEGRSGFARRRVSVSVE